MKNILTYGTFDLFHNGHVQLLKRAKSLGGKLFVGVSSDLFNYAKGKESYFNEIERIEILKSCKYVDYVFLEKSWDQKVQDISKYDIDHFVMGDDWIGEFDHLKNFCKVSYFKRTPGISTSKIKNELHTLEIVA